MFRKTLLMLAAFLLFGSSQALPQEADSITIAIPGKGTIRVPALISITVDTVHDTTIVEVPVEIPCPDCPPPPAWECPAGWECIPPPEPEGPQIQITAERFALGTPDTVTVGRWYVQLDSQEWKDLGLGYDASPIPGVQRVYWFRNGAAVNDEGLYPYETNPRDQNLTAGTVEFTAIVRYTDATADTIRHEVVVVNPNVPPEPPDSTPPTPPDSTVPFPGDTIIGQIPLGTPQNIRLVQDTCWQSSTEPNEPCYLIEFDPIPEDTVTTCVNCGTWWERTAVVNDDDVIGDEIYYAVGTWEGPLPYDTTVAWQVGFEHELPTTRWMIPRAMYPLPDTMSICVRASAWDARSYEGPGGAIRYCGDTNVGWQCSHLYPISETNCTTLTGG